MFLNLRGRSRVVEQAFPGPFAKRERHHQRPHHRRIQSRGHLKESQDLRHLPLDRLDADAEMLGDFQIGGAVGNPGEDGGLPRGETGDEFP